MATFHPDIRTKDKDFNTVYIRISHNSKTDYIKTNMLLHKSGIRKGRITDSSILANCAIMIRKYIEKTNRFNISSWTVRELKDFLMSDSEDISFSEYAEGYIRQMRNDGRKKPAGSYSVALRSLEKHHGRPLNFTDLTSKSLREWIATLSGTKWTKQLYPVIIKKLFNEGRHSSRLLFLYLPLS